MAIQEQVIFPRDEFKSLLKPDEIIKSFEGEHEKEAKADPDFASRVIKRHEQNKTIEAHQGFGKWVMWGAVAVALLGSCAVTVVGPVGTWINNATYGAQEKSVLSPWKDDNKIVGENYFFNSLQDFGSLRNGSSGFLDQYDYFQNPSTNGSTNKQIFDLRADGFRTAIKLASAKKFDELEKLKTQKGFEYTDVKLDVSLLKSFSDTHSNLSGPDLMIEYYKMQTGKQGMKLDEKTIVDLTVLITK
jgi:hypothetical protein